MISTGTSGPLPGTAVALPGGRTAGATRHATTVVRRGGPWTPTVHAVLKHLETAGFTGAPRVLGTDAAGQEILSYLEGHTVGDSRPWPAWVRSNEALNHVGCWLRRLHDTTASFVPPAEAHWFAGQTWHPGLIIGHHDAAPFNAVWNEAGLVGFIDWDTAGPSTPDLDLAYTALWWVPLIQRPGADPDSFTQHTDRSRRLHLLLDAYQYTGDRTAFGATIARRARINAAVIHRLAATGNPTYQAMLTAAADLEQAAHDADTAPTAFWAPT